MTPAYAGAPLASASPPPNLLCSVIQAVSDKLVTNYEIFVPKWDDFTIRRRGAQERDDAYFRTFAYSFL
jgi:hypothetical protein